MITTRTQSIRYIVIKKRKNIYFAFVFFRFHFIRDWRTKLMLYIRMINFHFFFKFIRSNFYVDMSNATVNIFINFCMNHPRRAQ